MLNIVILIRACHLNELVGNEVSIIISLITIEKQSSCSEYLVVTIVALCWACRRQYNVEEIAYASYIN